MVESPRLKFKLFLKDGLNLLDWKDGNSSPQWNYVTSRQTGNGIEEGLVWSMTPVIDGQQVAPTSLGDHFYYFIPCIPCSINTRLPPRYKLSS